MSNATDSLGRNNPLFFLPEFSGLRRKRKTKINFSGMVRVTAESNRVFHPRGTVTSGLTAFLLLEMQLIIFDLLYSNLEQRYAKAPWDLRS
jgi:hypothetical protein